MAVVPELPGLEVTVEVEGESLAEYEYQPQHDLQDVAATNVVSRYVEAPSGEAFAIRTSYKPPYDPTSSVHVDIVLDGNYILAPLEERAGKDNCQGYKYANSTSIVEGVSSTQTFRFGDFKPGKCNAITFSPLSKLTLRQRRTMKQSRQKSSRRSRRLARSLSISTTSKT
jgi:hypothetical protein